MGFPILFWFSGHSTTLCAQATRHLVDGVTRMVGDTGGHRKIVDTKYFEWMQRAKIVVTCNFPASQRLVEKFSLNLESGGVDGVARGRSIV